MAEIPEIVTDRLVLRELVDYPERLEIQDQITAAVHEAFPEFAQGNVPAHDDFAMRLAELRRSASSKLKYTGRSDVEELYEIMKQPEVMAYYADINPIAVYGLPAELDLDTPKKFFWGDIAKFIREARESWEQHGYGRLGIELRGKIIGYGGLSHEDYLNEGTLKTGQLDYRINKKLNPTAGLSYRIGREYWGQGYAPEAAAATLRFAFEQLEMESVVSCMEPENAASRRVAEKMGMRHMMTLPYHSQVGKDTFFEVHRITYDEWQRQMGSYDAGVSPIVTNRYF